MSTLRVELRAVLFFFALSLLSANSLLAEDADSKPPELMPKPASVAGIPDPMLERSWHLGRIGALDVWKTTKGDPRVTIAIVDSGINYNHPDLSPNIRWNQAEWPTNGRDKDGNGFIDDVIGWDFVRNFHLPYDGSGHGTFMAGIIAAVEGNGIGGAGVCPRCSILPVRFLNAKGMGDTSDAIKAIDYATQNGASVINYSVSGEGYDQELYEVFQRTITKDIVVVVAASNDGEDLDKSSIYPAKLSLPNMITVAATDRKDELLPTSNWGIEHVHLAAPGDEMVSTYFQDYADDGAGTSDAAAVVTGAIGLIRSAFPKLSATEVVELVKSTVTMVPGLNSKTKTGGILDVKAAFAKAARQSNSR